MKNYLLTTQAKKPDTGGKPGTVCRSKDENQTQ